MLTREAIKALVLCLVITALPSYLWGLYAHNMLGAPYPPELYGGIGTALGFLVWLIRFRPWAAATAVATASISAPRAVGTAPGLPVLGDLRIAHAVALVLDSLTGVVYALAVTHFVGNLYTARVTFPGGGVRQYLLVLEDGHKLGYLYGLNLPVYVVEGKSILPQLFIGRSIEVAPLGDSIISIILGSPTAFMGVRLPSEPYRSRFGEGLTATSDPEVIAETLLKLTEDMSANMGSAKLIEITPNLVVGVSREAVKQIVLGALRAIKQRSFDSLVMVNELIKQGDRFEKVAEVSSRVVERAQLAAGMKWFYILFGIACVVAVLISLVTPGGLAGLLASPFMPKTTPPKHTAHKPAMAKPAQTAPPPSPPPAAKYPANQTVIKVGENVTAVQRPVRPGIKK